MTSIIRRLRRLVAFTAALVALTAVTAGAATACSTFQYDVRWTGTTVRSTPGGTVIKTLTFPQSYEWGQGVKANITQRPGAWYYGNFYYYGAAGTVTPATATGWVLAENLDYQGICW